MKIFTIGFTGKTAAQFFESLRSSRAKHLLDIRISNTSQLSGFTKKQDLPYLLERLAGMEYHELKELAPTKDMFRRYRKDKDWERYKGEYLGILKERGAIRELNRAVFLEGGVLLCSEPTPERCHRRLAAELLQQQLFLDAEIVHL